MDRKTIILLAACFAAFLLFRPLVDKVFPPTPLPPGSTNNVSTTQTPTVAEPVAMTNPSPATGAVASPAVSSLPVFATNVAEVELTVTNDNARYTFTSRGGGIKEIELLHYPEKVSRKKISQTNGVATLNDGAQFPVLSLIGDSSVQGDGVYELSETEDGVRAEKLLPNGLKIVKEFHVSTNYLVHANVSYVNTGSDALALPAHEFVVGTATPMAADDPGMNVGMMWFNGSKSRDITRPWFDNKSFGCFPGTPRNPFTGGNGDVVWAAAHNQYFAIIAMPAEPAGQVVAEMVPLPRPPLDELPPNRRNAPPPVGYLTRISCPTAIVQAGGTLTREISFYAGPKEYRTLARIAVHFKNDVDRIMRFGWAGFFAKALLLSMNWLHHTFGLSYALAIIAITVIMKMVFWPITASQARMSKRMAAFQPQMKALQEKYKEDPLKLQKKMSEFWKEHKINPMSGCLPVLIQMPVFIGFFGMIRTAIELRGESFLWVADLSKPDTLFTIPGIGFPFNLLPLLMGATMLWQAHVAPTSPSADPTQAKMMKYLPLIFLIFLYNFSAGLTLYWTISNLLTILQTKLTKKIDAGLPTPTQSPALTPTAKKRK